MLKAVEWKQKQLFVIDQSKLPNLVTKIQLRTALQAIDAIQLRKVKGGQLLGVIAAFTVYLAIKQPPLAKNFDKLFKETEKICNQLLKLVPTSMDVEWSLTRMKRCVLNHRDHKLNTLRDFVAREAVLILKEYEKAGKTILEYGQDLIRDNDCILTYGNPGALSTPGQGSALDIIAHGATKKELSVIVPETRPFLDGTRLTAVELKHSKVPFQIISDNAIAHMMQSGKINIVMLGADRIAMNGDVAAVIGTYGLAMLAYHHRIPVYVCASVATYDRTLVTGDPINIEEYKAEVLLKFQNKLLAKPGTKAIVPELDITPRKYISALITDLGIIRAPFDQNLNNLFSNLG